MGDSTLEWAHNKGQTDRAEGNPYSSCAYTLSPWNASREGEIAEAYADGWDNADDQEEED